MSGFTFLGCFRVYYALGLIRFRFCFAAGLLVRAPHTGDKKRGVLELCFVESPDS